MYKFNTNITKIADKILHSNGDFNQILKETLVDKSLILQDSSGNNIFHYLASNKEATKFLEKICDFIKENSESLFDPSLSLNKDEIITTLCLSLNNKGMSPTHIAAGVGNIDNLLALLTLGGELNILNSERITPLELIINSNKEDNIIKLYDFLKDQKQEAIFNKKYAGQNLLHIAVNKKSNKSLETLVKLVPEINNSYLLNQMDYKGRTPIMVACELNNLEAVKILEKEGADINFLNYQNKNAITIAHKNEALPIVFFLLNQNVPLEKELGEEIFNKMLFELNYKLNTSLFNEFGTLNSINEEELEIIIQELNIMIGRFINKDNDFCSPWIRDLYKNLTAALLTISVKKENDIQNTFIASIKELLALILKNVNEDNYTTLKKESIKEAMHQVSKFIEISKIYGKEKYSR